jgi:tetratricopeptide (TPR) repeat protein
MKSFYRWICKHSVLCRFALLFGLTAFTVWSATLPYVPFLGIYLVDIIIWVFATRFIAGAPGKLLLEPMEIMNQQCDPHPFLEETKRQLAMGVNGPQQQLNEINYATALRMVGDNYKVAEILETINIDRFPGTTPYMKFIYYNNLADVLFALDRTAEGLIWNRKALMIFRDLPENKMKQQLVQTSVLCEAEGLYHQQEYSAALQKVAWLKCDSTRNLLDAALLAAKCHISLEEPEKAAEKLQYVITHGNLLHIVKEAQTLPEPITA